MTWRITQHAGAGILPNVSQHFLVATHAFLEMLHYAVWLVAIPLVALEHNCWRLSDIPLARRASWGHHLVAGILLMGATTVGVFWLCFAIDHGFTRDVYFTLAFFHVLAEIPFLLRAL